MNHYPLWKYTVILVALTIGLLYTLPNLFGETPTMQVSSGKATVKVDLNVQKQVESLLAAASIRPDGVFFDNNGTSASVRVRFADTDTQFKAKDVLARGLNTDQVDPTYIVALNLLPGSPQWLSGALFSAKPMFLGLDLRSGVHFLLQVDMNGAVTKKPDSLTGDIRTQLRDKGIRHSGVDRNNNMISIKFSNPNEADRTRTPLTDSTRGLAYTVDKSADGAMLAGIFTAAAVKEVQDNAVKQNIVTLHSRVNGLGVAEPVIQQQGPDRIVVQLPGVWDTAKAKDIISRTATLETHLANPNTPLTSHPGDPVPLGSELFTQGRSAPVLLQKQMIFIGDRITSASAGFDQNHNSSVDIMFDGQGGRMLRDVSRDNIDKRMDAMLFEKGKDEALTVTAIQSELGSHFQITGTGSTEAASDLALLLRAGLLAAPAKTIERRTIGPSLGVDDIKKGFGSALYGFLAISVFMVLYYMLFGAFSVAALGVNVFLLTALLSMLQATLTLLGIAAIALALGVAIDANVLISERVREELRGGTSAQMAVTAGFDHVWAAILDSNVTTLIAGLALIAFGSGPVRDFAIIHCLGTGTSMFSAVFFNRGLVNLWYGRKKKLQSAAIGQVWKLGNTSTESPAK